ncbi:MAG: DUF4011 domain-containing protein, partial [Planctomycetota bacterium]
RRRPQDMANIASALENYRDQAVDLEFDLARAPESTAADPPTRTETILTCLRRRLFDVSRRNRLLHFRPTNQSINLTWASVPLAFDVQTIRPEQILTANKALQKILASGSPLSLNKYLRFEEAVYLPGQLDAIRSDARRDQAEFGFAQLRLVLCFLRWSNLKSKPPERYDSPLVLLPVRLEKTKGVRDIYTLEATSSDAEINPVLRHHLHQLYGIELPSAVDLESSSLDELFEFLKARIQATEPAVTLEDIDKPRINVIHAQAQRRLDQYRRRARLSGRGVRSYLNLDYSYNQENYHPLGLRLFQTRLTPTETRLRSIVDETPRPRTSMAPAPPKGGAGGRERQLFSKVDEQTNPFVWEFDRCNVTLGNFHYRKMSLVRDYETLIAGRAANPGFEALFSLDPKPTDIDTSLTTPLHESFPIVACDSAQSAAIAMARTKKPFIIQGPPGTGKSQTITNLIADYVARGLRILFVCEKRAAIDVVFQRLRLAGLDGLCCLIHDSQGDKKAFILDLKQTYETLLESPASGPSAEDKRDRLLKAMHKDLEPLQHVHQYMSSTPAQAGVTVRHLLERAIELQTSNPKLSPAQRDRLPDYSLWHGSREASARLSDHLAGLGDKSILAEHPLRSLHARFATQERPLEAIRAGLAAAQATFDEIDGALEELKIAADCRRNLAEIRALGAYGTSLSLLAQIDLLLLLKPKSDLLKKLTRIRKDYAARAEDLARAAAKTTAWRNKLSPAETQDALAQAEALEGNLFRFFKPNWWRLRGVLHRSYDVSTHEVTPSASQILKTLQAEHDARAKLDLVEADAKRELEIEVGLADLNRNLSATIETVGKLSSPLQALHKEILASPEGADTVLKLAALDPAVKRLDERLGLLIDGPEAFSWDELRDELALIDEAIDEFPDFKPCLNELAALPASVAAAWRRNPWNAAQIEAAVVRRTAEELLRADPVVSRFTAATQESRAESLGAAHERWRSANAEVAMRATLESIIHNEDLLKVKLEYPVRVVVYRNSAEAKPAQRPRAATFDQQIVTGGSRVATDVLHIYDPLGGFEDVARHEAGHIVTKVAGDGKVSTLPS